MKKILLLIIAATLSIGGVSAQKISKAEKKAKKEAAFQENLEKITAMFTSKELTFVPNEMSTNTSGRTMINKYEFLKLNPEYIESDMSYLAEDRLGKIGPTLEEQTDTNSGSKKVGDKGSMTKKIVNLRIGTTIFEITKNEPTKYGYQMVIETENNQQKLTLTLNANAKNNITSLKIESNRNSDVLYKGTVRPN